VKSMNRIGNRCQAVPDREHGIVFGLDIGKDTITYRACRPEMAGKPRIVSQDMAGFRKIVAAMEDYAERGYEVWVGYEPTGAYSCCVCEFSSGRHKGKRRISKCGRAGVRYTLCLAATKMTGKSGIYP
jgi:transposase